MIELYIITKTGIITEVKCDRYETTRIDEAVNISLFIEKQRIGVFFEIQGYYELNEKSNETSKPQ